jgi:ATP-dependent Clp protease ATP-binding subunit ClpA
VVAAAAWGAVDLCERFATQARQVIVLAQQDARGLRHDRIGTEHVLVGLVREQHGVAACVLGELGVSEECVREGVARIVGRGETRLACATVVARDSRASRRGVHGRGA